VICKTIRKIKRHVIERKGSNEKQKGRREGLVNTYSSGLSEG
jgi:hypothetical protein